MTRGQITMALLACVLAVGAGFFATRATLRARHAQRTVENLTEECARWRTIVARREDVAQRLTTVRIDKPATAASTPRAAIDQLASSTSSAPDSPSLHLRALQADAQLTLDRFFRARTLSPEQRGRVTHRIAELNRALLLLWREVPPEGRQQRRHEENARFEADMKQLLGSEGFADYERFQKTLPHWRYVTRLATQLFRTTDALTAAQATQLAQIITTHATTSHGTVARSPANWDAVYLQASGVLSPAQLETFKALKERADLHEQLNRMIARAR